jgi:uncharacterized protein (TIGR02996 family)
LRQRGHAEPLPATGRACSRMLRGGSSTWQDVRVRVTEPSNRTYDRNRTVYPSLTTRTELNSHSALLTLILENPADDTARLVLADLLLESDDPDTQARGRFLWGAVTTARYSTTGAIVDDTFRTALKEVNSIIEEGYPARWLSKLGIGPTPLIRQDWKLKRKQDRYRIIIGIYEGVFTRGMLSELTIPHGEGMTWVRLHWRNGQSNAFL